MRAILIPRTPLCGACGSVLYVLYADQRPHRAIVHCALKECEEYNRRYVLDCEVRELKPLPETEIDG
jgi:hypothetical protein